MRCPYKAVVRKAGFDCGSSRTLDFYDHKARGVTPKVTLWEGSTQKEYLFQAVGYLYNKEQGIYALYMTG